MYTFILLLLLGAGLYVFLHGRKKHRKFQQATGILIAALTILFFLFMTFWGDYLWFDAIGYENRFWIEYLYKAVMLVSGLLLVWLITHILIFTERKKSPDHYRFAMLVNGLVGAIWGVVNWNTILQYINREPSGVADPIFAKDASFYMFTLPLLQQLYVLLLLTSFITFFSMFIAATGMGKYYRQTGPEDGWSFLAESKRHPGMYISMSFLILVLAFGKYINRFKMLFSDLGTVSGPGWTDVHVSLPGYTITILITAIVALLILNPSVRKSSGRLLRRMGSETSGLPGNFLLLTGGILLLSWLIFLTLVPGLFQWLKVEPNEITLEKPYIENNIQFTRLGFNLNRIEEAEYKFQSEFNREIADNNEEVFSNIRLWDWRALDAVYKQFQEIRLYYEFKDVDVDRYTFAGRYNQVMVSAREMEIRNLPRQSRTFVNERFKYTHGNGITLSKVNEFTENGLPRLLVKNIPPRSEYPELEVEQPRIYYGELTNTPVIVNSSEEEFDYPSGEKNIYFNYTGDGGVPMPGFWRQLIYGWKFDGARLLFSGYPVQKSRIMFNRHILERIRLLAPFLKYDDDPYITLVDGKLYWIIDAYTWSENYPYSEPFRSLEQVRILDQGEDMIFRDPSMSKFENVNYLRNSVKVVIDAYNGTTNLYVFEKDDPVIRVWDNIFPGLLKDREAMPEGLADHVRYPIDMLLAQGLVYAKYHMGDPAVFYNQEDLWVRATEKYYDRIQPVEPYYIMWRPSGSGQPEFTLILPFTPKNRQVLVGWLAGMCDGENYGRFLAYKFPKDMRILGPQQVETKIDQDSFLSGQLSLWDQRGSRVIRGNVLAIPVDKTIIYVEPIYLQSETAAFPELRLVAVMHEDQLSYAETFGKALEGLYGVAERPPGAEQAEQPAARTVDDLIQRANDAFNRYIEHTGNREFDGAARAIQELKEILEDLSEKES